MNMETLSPAPGRVYLERVIELVNAVAATQWDGITAAADAMAAALVAGHELHAFGSGHSHMLAEELFYRAGGLVDVRPILFDPLMLHHSAQLSTQLERVSGLAELLLDDHGVAAGDVLIAFSNSGRNAVTSEMAAEARDRGLTVIGVTSLLHSAQAAPRGDHARLLEVCDIVLDNGGVPGDAAVRVPGFDRPVAPTSTAVGAAIVNALVAETVARIAASSQTPRVFSSSNIDLGDAINEGLLGRPA